MLTLTAIAVALMLPQDPPPPPPPPERPEVRTRMMVMGGPGGARMDANGDGDISREEFSAQMNSHFGQMDSNGDGRISADEMQAGHGAGGERHVMRMRRAGPDGGPMSMADRDIEIVTSGGDGNERRMEWTSEDGTQRQVVIVRGDGPMPDMPMPPPPPGGPGAPHVLMMGPMGGPSGHGAPMMRMENQNRDTDGDGKVSLQEFTAPMAEVFARLDTDHSGYLEESERGANRQVFVTTRAEYRDHGDGDGDGEH